MIAFKPHWSHPALVQHFKSIQKHSQTHIENIPPAASFDQLKDRAHDPVFLSHTVRTQPIWLGGFLLF
jgi:hypothetical protein